MKKLLLVLPAAILAKSSLPLENLPAKKQGVTRIITIGDSITQGKCTTDEESMSWPGQLSDMLHNNRIIEVVNLANSGRTMMRRGDYPYWNEIQYQLALSSEADFVFIMLGTNDSKYFQWNETAYIEDYRAMASSFLAMPSSPKIYFMIPPPLYQDNAYSMNQRVINSVLPRVIPQIAESLSQPSESVIDIFSEMGGEHLSEWHLFCNGQNCDTCHPNDAGQAFIAKAVYKQIFITPIPEIGPENYRESMPGYFDRYLQLNVKIFTFVKEMLGF